MNRSTILMLMTILSISFLQMGCKDDPPIPPETPPKPKRDFVWTIDTLEYPGSLQTLMRSIWGSSSNNIYVVGHNERGFGKMYHFDGTSWKPVDLTSATNNAAITLNSIFGFASNDIYAVGMESFTNPFPPYTSTDSSLILHFDGHSWNRINLTNRKRFLLDIHGSNSKNIYAGGFFGSLYHYDGINWQILSVPESLHISSLLSTTDSALWIGVYTYNILQTEDHWYFLEYKNNAVSIKNSYHSNSGEATLGLDLKTIGQKIYATDPYFFRYEESTWTLLKKNIGTSFTDMAATHESNIFLVGLWDVVLHYNGEDWYEYSKFFINPENVSYTSVWTDGKEVFIVGNANGTPMRTVILHGK